MKKTINGISYNSQREFVSNLNKISKAGERYQAPGRDTTYTFYTIAEARAFYRAADKWKKTWRPEPVCAYSIYRAGWSGKER